MYRKQAGNQEKALLVGWLLCGDEYIREFKAIAQQLDTNRKLASLNVGSSNYSMYLVPPSLITDEWQARLNWRIVPTKEMPNVEPPLFFVMYMKSGKIDQKEDPMEAIYVGSAISGKARGKSNDLTSRGTAHQQNEEKSGQNLPASTVIYTSF